jgi:hypothetical protein
MYSTPHPGLPGLMSVTGLIASIQQNMTFTTPEEYDKGSQEEQDWAFKNTTSVTKLID